MLAAGKCAVGSKEHQVGRDACKSCEQETGEANIVKAVKEPALLPGSFASAEAVAYLAAQKFVMHSPLYRLQQEFERQGLKLSRQTMSNWLLSASEDWLEPIYDALHAQPLYCMSTSQHARRSTRRISCGISPAGCTQMDTRATTNCLKISVWWAAGHMRGENLTRRWVPCRKRNGRILLRPWANAIARSFSSWSRHWRS